MNRLPENMVYSDILDLLPDASVVIDSNAIIIHTNLVAEKMFGYHDGTLCGNHINQLVPPPLRAHHTGALERFFVNPASRRLASGMRLTGYRTDGSTFPVDISLGIISQRDGTVVLATIRDMTHQLQAEESLQQTNRALRLLSASNRSLLHCRSEDEQLAQICRIAVEEGGYRMAWVGLAHFDEGQSVIPAAWYGMEDGFLKNAQMSWGDGERGKSAMSTAIRTNTVQLRLDILNDPDLAYWHQAAREHNYQSAIAIPLRVQADVIGALAIYAPEPDAFHEKEIALLQELADDLSFGIQSIRISKAHEYAQSHIRQLAYYDKLTGLPNRALFTEQLERELAAAATERRKIALLLLGLNHLREINETYGHTLGDTMLMRTASQLQEVCGDDCFLASFSNNDFTVICTNDNTDFAASLSESILAAISVPLELSGDRMAITGNIGLALYPDDGETAAELLSKADLAMSRAREIGSGSSFYHPEMRQKLLRTINLSHRLTQAMQGDRLELYYQPKVELITGRIIGAEALVRWNDPELGWISPAEFIPVAESRGMMVELGNWVLQTACNQIHAWQQSGFLCHGRIAVNVSAKQLEDPNFLGQVQRIIAESGISFESLELELTESVIMANPELVIGILNELKGQGIKLAIDDFGTGYSSLAYLKQLPVDTLKIDQSFVRDMLEDPNDQAIVATIVAIGRQLGLTLVAEGVEKEQQSIQLKQMGCHFAQGYFYSRPEPADIFTVKRVEERNCQCQAQS